MVSGEIISGVDYAEWIANADPFFEVMKDLYDDKVGSEMSSSVVDEIAFIHLKDTTIFVGSGQLKVNYWRGLIARVDGWTIGRVKPAPAGP